MNKFCILIACLLMMAGPSFGQASFSLTDSNGDPVSGTYNSTGKFTISVFGTATGYNADSFELWLETQTLNGFNNSLTITSETWFQFTYHDPFHPVIDPKVFDSATGADVGYLTDRAGGTNGDLGAAASDPSLDFTGTAHLMDITFGLNNAPAGTYLLKTTTIQPRGSLIWDDQLNFHYAGQSAVYTITIVPEPSAWLLLATGAVTAGISAVRKRKLAH